MEGGYGLLNPSGSARELMRRDTQIGRRRSWLVEGGAEPVMSQRDDYVRVRHAMANSWAGLAWQREAPARRWLMVQDPHCRNA